jgi:uncharacterized membrane protein
VNDPVEPTTQRTSAAAVGETAGPLPTETSEEEAITRLELIVSYLLRFGVALSLTITFVGLMLLLFTDPTEAVVRLTGGFVARSPWTVFAGLRLLRPKAIIEFGLILLIVTPVFRVAVTAIAFILERDWIYTAITLFVLAVLLTSFFLGQAG